MKNKADVQIRTILGIADQMIALSEKGFASCVDDGCLLLNGMVRECAYRLRDAAELERTAHETTEKLVGSSAQRAVGESTVAAMAKSAQSPNRQAGAANTEIVKKPPSAATKRGAS